MIQLPLTPLVESGLNFHYNFNIHILLRKKLIYNLITFCKLWKGLCYVIL